MSNSSAHHALGLTALDLAISLAITALLIAAAIPALRQINQQQRMKAAVAQFHGDLALARNGAILGNTRVVTCAMAMETACAGAGEWQQGWMVFEDSNDDLEWQETEPVLRRTGPVAGLAILSSAYRGRLRFFPNGTAPGSNATVTFCDARGPRAARQLTVSASGRLRLRPPDETDGSACQT